MRRVTPARSATASIEVPAKPPSRNADAAARTSCECRSAHGRRRAVSAAIDQHVYTSVYLLSMSNGFSTVELAERRAIVTGGASGIGKATAIAMAEAGAEVVVTDIDEAGGANVA